MKRETFTGALGIAVSARDDKRLQCVVLGANAVPFGSICFFPPETARALGAHLIACADALSAKEGCDDAPAVLITPAVTASSEAR